MPERTVVIAGASGLVGRQILEGLLADAGVAHVHALVRRPLELRHVKLTEHVVDFAALLPPPGVDETYLALGTTIKVAGSQAAFRAVDFDANLAVARAAQAEGCRRIGLVSAMGADARSTIFYNRVKGELEEALSQLPLDALVIARPSLLIGDRTELGQRERPGERMGEKLGKLLGPLVPANLRPIAAGKVAGALLARVPVAKGREVLLSGRMQGSF
jgi:uncharacterized protein YbjT (DUF2867 family)